MALRRGFNLFACAIAGAISSMGVKSPLLSPCDIAVASIAKYSCRESIDKPLVERAVTPTATVGMVLEPLNVLFAKFSALEYADIYCRTLPPVYQVISLVDSSIFSVTSSMRANSAIRISNPLSAWRKMARLGC